MGAFLSRSATSRRLLAAAGALTAAAVLTACGDTATQVAAPNPTTVVKETTVERAAPAARVVRVDPWKECDANVRARRGTTSCAFAENVFYGFAQANRAGDDGFSAYSPLTGESYPMVCSAGTTVNCLAGDGGHVRFAMAAVDAYTPDQARDYCESHDTTGEGSGSGCDAAEDETAPAQDSECDPNYEGQCLDPNSADYDCEGGSGDGPDYAGPVDVVGDDPFDLDRDGDGSACETS